MHVLTNKLVETISSTYKWQSIHATERVRFLA